VDTKTPTWVWLLAIIAGVSVASFIPFIRVDNQNSERQANFEQQVRAVQLPQNWGYQSFFNSSEDRKETFSYDVEANFYVFIELVENSDNVWLVKVTYPRKTGGDTIPIAFVDSKQPFVVLSTTSTSLEESFHALLKALHEGGFTTIVSTE
jgi:hypothetical protein